MRSIVVSCGAVLIAGLCSVVPAQEKPKPPADIPKARPLSEARIETAVRPPAAASSEEALHKGLRSRMNVMFHDTPLDEAIEYLERKSDISHIRIDEKDLKAEGVALDGPVRLTADGATLGQVLHRILPQQGLTWIADANGLRIVTQARSDRIFPPRVWNVRRIVRAMEAEKQEDERRRKPTGGTPVLTSTGSATFSPSLGTDNLISTLQTASNGAWTATDGTGGNLKLSGDVLVVRQTDRAHSDVAGILRLLEDFVAGKLKNGASSFTPAWSPVEDDIAIAEALARKLPKREWNGVPLARVVEELSSQMKVRIAIDQQSLMGEGISPDEPTTLSLPEMSFSSAQHVLLDRLGLTCIIEHGFLVITTQVKALEILSVVLYDVTDLLKNSTVDQLIDTITISTRGPWWNVDGSGGDISIPLKGALVVRQTQKVHEEVTNLLAGLRRATLAAAVATAEPDPPRPPDGAAAKLETRFYPLARAAAATQAEQTIPKFVAPQTWKGAGGDGVIGRVGGTLIVRQTRTIHEEIQSFLDKLKTAEDAPPAR